MYDDMSLEGIFGEFDSLVADRPYLQEGDATVAPTCSFFDYADYERQALKNDWRAGFSADEILARHGYDRSDRTAHYIDQLIEIWED